MAQYDENKRYSWGPETTFTLNGQEFGLILNTVRSYLASEEATRFQLMYQTNQVIEEVLKNAVENNIVLETEEQKEFPPLQKM